MSDSKKMTEQELELMLKMILLQKKQLNEKVKALQESQGSDEEKLEGLFTLLSNKG
jgi:hypothetical protein